MTKWNARMIHLAKVISTWSKDIERQVGCVITTKDYHIVSTGYNGFPSSCSDENTNNKNLRTVHAELNALLRLTTRESELRLFIYGGHPCAQCAAAILQQKIKYIISPRIEEQSSWHASMCVAADMFISCPDIVYKVYTY